MNHNVILKQIRATLEKDTRINLHRYPITIATQNGDLILSGDVESIAAKKLALLAAAEIHGVQRIVDRLKVTPAEKMEDAEISDHVCKVLIEEPAFEQCIVHGFAEVGVEAARKSRLEPAPSINVEVADGVATLNGQIPSLSHKRLAGVLAWWVPGTREVINGLEEVPPEDDNDDELIDAVRLVLEKDPWDQGSSVAEASRTVTQQGGEVLSVGTYRSKWGESPVCYLRLRSADADTVAAALRVIGFDVLGVHPVGG